MISFILSQSYRTKDSNIRPTGHNRPYKGSNVGHRKENVEMSKNPAIKSELLRHFHRFYSLFINACLFLFPHCLQQSYFHTAIDIFCTFSYFLSPKQRADGTSQGLHVSSSAVRLKRFKCMFMIIIHLKGSKQQLQ